MAESVGAWLAALILAALILMGVQMLKAKTTDPSVQRVLSVMESNTQRGAGLVRQVLLFFREHAPRLRLAILSARLTTQSLATQLRETFPRLPLLLITSAASQPPSPTSASLPKPFTLQTLLSKVHALLPPTP